LKVSLTSTQPSTVSVVMVTVLFPLPADGCSISQSIAGQQPYKAPPRKANGPGQIPAPLVQRARHDFESLGNLLSDHLI